MTNERVRSAASESQPVLPKGSLKLLLALVSSEATETDGLRRKLKVSDQDYRSLLHVLQQRYLVDVVSHLEGEEIHETLCLTEYGKSVLTDAMERTCELPE